MVKFSDYPYKISVDNILDKTLEDCFFYRRLLKYITKYERESKEQVSEVYLSETFAERLKKDFGFLETVSDKDFLKKGTKKYVYDYSQDRVTSCEMPQKVIRKVEEKDIFELYDMYRKIYISKHPDDSISLFVSKSLIELYYVLDCGYDIFLVLEYDEQIVGAVMSISSYEFGSTTELFVENCVMQSDIEELYNMHVKKAEEKELKNFEVGSYRCPFSSDFAFEKFGDINKKYRLFTYPQKVNTYSYCGKKRYSKKKKH